MGRTFLFSFDSAERARLFVVRLALRLWRVAIHIDGAVVRVVDGSDEGQGEEILRLAKGSRATHARFTVGPEE